MRLRIFLPLMALAGLAVAQDKAPPVSDTAPPPHKHVRLAGFAIGAGFSNGPAFYPGYAGRYGYSGGYGFYDPFFLSPYLYPGFFTGYGPAADRGAVKLQSADKDAAVYLDGAYAGQAAKLKTMWLDPGVYNVELRSATATTYQKRIYVLAGKTLKLDSSEVR